MDNLRSVDRELQYFRDQLQTTERWDKSTVLVTSDHWIRKPTDRPLENYNLLIRQFENRWNTKDHHVPFLLKLPHQSSDLTRESSFNTVITRSRLFAPRTGKISTPRKVSSWLRQNTPYSESHSTQTLP